MKTASGATAVQIMEKQGRRNVPVRHVGSAHSEAELAVLMQAAQDELHPGQLAFDFAPAAGGDRCAACGSKRSALLWQVLSKAYADLGFDVLEGEAFEQMVLARIVKPCSKEATIVVLKRLGVPHVSVRTLYASLARCAQRSYRDWITAACFAHAATCGDFSLVLYDVTTLYFEAEKEDETWEANEGFRRIGYSKERRVDPQIIVGLLVDREGNPLEVEAFEGNKTETHTLLPLVRRFQTRHGLYDFVVVADAGMLSAANLKALDEAGVYVNCRRPPNTRPMI